MLVTITRTLAVLAALAAALLVALAVTALRALDARGVHLAGGLLDAMGARRSRRSTSAHPYRSPAPANRRRAFARFADFDPSDDTAASVGEHGGRVECRACEGTGEGWSGRRCGSCGGRGERVLPALDLDGWQFSTAGAL